MTTYTFQIKEVKRDGYIAWDAIEDGSGQTIPLTEPFLVAGKYPEIESYLERTRGIKASISYDDTLRDRLVGQTWTFLRGEHTVIVRDIPRTILRLSGLTS